jgi:hypothetical protein
MGTESEKYKKIITLLRESTPELKSPEIVEREVMKIIAGKNRGGISADSVISFFFSWVYVGWIRRSLIAVSAILVAVFIWQQSIIVRQLNFLNNRIVISEIDNVKYQPRMNEKKLLMMGRGNQGFSNREVKISEDKIEQLLDSYLKLQSDYSELVKLINDDPELKKLIEEKAKQKNLSKIKL